MDNNYDEQLLIMKSTIESNKQETDDKIANLTEDLKSMFTSIIVSIMDHTNNYK